MKRCSATHTLQFSIGITHAEEALVSALSGGTIVISGFPLAFPPAPAGFRWDPADGPEEHVTFAAAFRSFDPLYSVGPANLFQMFEEASTGTSGATGRQVTLSVASMTPPNLAATQALLDDLEAADARGVINLRGRGRRNGKPRTVSYEAAFDHYQVGPDEIPRSTLEAEAANGDLLVTLTGHLPRSVGLGTHPQPLLGPEHDGDGPSGTNPDIPVFGAGNPAMDLEGINVRGDAVAFVDGQPDTSATIQCLSGSFSPFCSTEHVRIQLSSAPSGNRLHLLQVQNGPAGPLSNEMPICVGSIANCD